MSSETFRNLIAWQKAMDLAEAVCRGIATFPDYERFGLASQLRRAAVSVPSNIAEGSGRESLQDFLRFLSIAYGSLCEAGTQLLLAKRLEYLDERKYSELLALASEVGRLVNGLSNSLRKRIRD